MKKENQSEEKKHFPFAHLIFLICFFTSSVLTFAQTEKRPTLMIFPSDHWCEQRFYMTILDNQGAKVKMPDYQTAFLQDRELSQVISKIGQLLTEQGYSLKDAEQEVKSIRLKSIEDKVTLSNTNSSSIAESMLDKIKKHAKMDILIQIDWSINANHSVTFTLEAFDTYTSKRIATATGTGKPSRKPLPIMLEQAIKSKIKDFDKQMLEFYTNCNEYGREVVITVKCWEEWGENLEIENEDGDELLDIIEKWLKKNTVNGAFNISDASENFAQFEQVRIPLYDEDGYALDARGFANKLRKYINNECNITSKVMTRGLGEAIIIIGEK